MTLAALLALGAAACGQAAAPAPGSARPSPAPVGTPGALASVRAALAGAGSGSVAFRLALTGATVFGRAPTSVAGAGAFDIPGQRGALTLDLPAGGGVEPVVFAPRAVYVRPLAGGGLLPPGRPWLLASLQDPAALDRNFPRLILQVESLNPAFALSEVGSGSTAAVPAGPEAVGGRSVPAYDVTVELHRALANAASRPFEAALASQISALTEDSPAAPGATRMTVRAWVTEAGQLVGLQMVPPGAGLGVVTMTFSGLGAAVRAEPPPADQVVDIGSVTPFGERENENGGDSDGG